MDSKPTLDFFQKKLKMEIEKATKKGASEYEKYYARYSIACCLKWGYTLKDIMEMRLKVDKEINKKTEDIKRVSCEYKLLFCLEAMEVYYHRVLAGKVFFASSKNYVVNEEKIKECCNYMTDFINQLSQYPVISDELIEQSQKMLGDKYQKRFFNKLYKKSFSTKH